MLRITGNSGKEYLFDELFFHRSRYPKISSHGGVFLFLRKKNNGKYYPVYCDESSNMAHWFYSRKEDKSILNGKPNRFCVLGLDSSEQRRKVKEDIIGNANLKLISQMEWMEEG